MKKIYSLIIAAVLISAALGASAQNNNNNNGGGGGNGFSQLIQSSPADATKLLQNFAEPLFKGFGIGLNSGWNNTAKPKKFLHFDIRITANVAQVPASAQTFDVTAIGLSNHLALDPASPTKLAPTFGGSTSNPTPLMDIKDDNGNKIGSFSMPNGVIQYVPAPNVQFTLGIGLNTDVTLRTTPTISIGSNSGSVSMTGFGIKHDIIQDFAKKGTPKPFDLAVAVNYNRINYNVPLTVTPDNGDAPATSSTPTNFSNQHIQGTFSGTNAQLIISKRLLFFTPFLSVGYQTATTDFAALGTYPISSSQGFYTTVTDPVHITETSVNGFRTDVGFQLNLLILRIFASYSPGQYQSVNGGVGLGF